MSVQQLQQAFSLYQAGSTNEAAVLCRSILSRDPKSGDAHHLLGIIAFRAGQLAEAAAHVRSAIRANARQAEYRNTKGAIERAAGNIDAAIESFKAALMLQPGHAQALANLGNALAQAKRFAEAAAAYRRALAVAPDTPGVHNNLGNVLRELGEIDAAIDSFEAALRLDPRYVEAYSNMGVALVARERFEDAIAAYRAALAIDPGHLGALANIGGALLVTGRWQEAMQAYAGAVALRDDVPQFHFNMVTLQNYLEDATPERTLALASRFDRTLSRPATVEPFANERTTDRPLRIGLVSADLHTHSVTRFLLPLVTAHDRSAIEFVAIAADRHEDEVTAQLRERFAGWHPINGLAAEAAASVVRSAQIDILIDLSGYTTGARLDLFAQRAAPVQAGWLGYSGTTGIAEMDYILADPFVAPPGSEAEFSETICRLPDSYLCFGQPDWPIPGDLPAQRNGYVTFGSFNNIGKVSEATLHRWVEILKAIPESRLVLKSSRGGVQQRLDELSADFAAAGIAPERLRLIDRLPDHAAHLALYDQIDIGLDPFPYNGTTTTCEALWMGVPVLTRRGNSFVSHVGESLMQSVGLPEWIADDDEDYVARAVRLASDTSRLAEIRAELRPRFAVSPLGDATRFARNFEAAMQRMWAHWCEATDGTRS